MYAALHCDALSEEERKEGKGSCTTKSSASADDPDLEGPIYGMHALLLLLFLLPLLVVQLLLLLLLHGWVLLWLHPGGPTT